MSTALVDMNAAAFSHVHCAIEDDILTSHLSVVAEGAWLVNPVLLQ